MAEFQPTLWSVVLRAKDPADPHCATALNRLCATYWPPVYVYLRRKGIAEKDAEDATQAYFTHFLSKNLLDRVDRGRGRFKNYLLATLEHFLANEWRVAHAAKRGTAPLSLDRARGETQVGIDPADPETPERAFKRSWALTVLQNAFDALKAELGATFDAVRGHLSAAGDRASYDELAKRLGIPVTDVTNLLHRSKKRLRDLIRSALRETVDSESAVDDEVRELFENL